MRVRVDTLEDVCCVFALIFRRHEEYLSENVVGANDNSSCRLDMSRMSGELVICNDSAAEVLKRSAHIARDAVRQK